MLARVFFAWVFRGHKPHVIFLRTPHHALPNVTAGGSGLILGTPFFWRRLESRIRS